MKKFALVLACLVSVLVQAKTDRAYISYQGSNIFSNTNGVYIQSANKNVLLSDEKIDKAIDELMAQPQQSNIKNNIDAKNDTPTLVDKPLVSEQTNKPEYESYDKRWVRYNEWEYRRIENDFNNLVIKTVELLSNDGNATLVIIYDVKDKKYQNPEVGIMLSGKYDGENWHNFLCSSNCLNVDFNVDGKKYPNISMKYGGKRFLTAKNPKTLLDKIRIGETIKVRILSVTGDYIIYHFEPETVLDLKKLRSL